MKNFNLGIAKNICYSRKSVLSKSDTYFQKPPYSQTLANTATIGWNLLHNKSSHQTSYDFYSQRLIQ